MLFIHSAQFTSVNLAQTTHNEITHITYFKE